ncbi:MAG: O-antigen ligase family protein [candidate division Zixibacteria bacterium]|nr:O-antigen ligase family protein [candidate division Zixibacteria bacterium]
MELTQQYTSSNLKEKLPYFGFIVSAFLCGWLLVRFPQDTVVGLGIFLTLVMIFLADIKLAVMILVFAVPLLTLTHSFTPLFPKSSYSINLGGMLNIFILLFTLLHVLLKRRTYENFFLTKPIVLFLGIALLTFLISYDRWITLREWFGYAMPIMFYFLILTSFENTREVEKLRNALIYSAFIPLACSLYQIFYWEPQPIGFNRVYATFMHPNAFACYLVVLMPSVVLLYSRTQKKNQKAFYSGIFALMSLSLFYTFTRVAWAAFIPSLIILGFSRHKKLFLKFVLIVLITILLLPGLGQMFTKRIQLDSSFYGRFDFNQFSLFLFCQKPILGHGLGTFRLFSSSIFDYQEERYERTLGVGAHNDYFKTLAETGLVGLFSFLFLFYSLLKMGRRIYLSGDYNLKSEALVLFAVVSGILVYGLTDAGLAYGGIYLWSTIGIAEARYRLNCAESKENAFR